MTGQLFLLLLLVPVLPAAEAQAPCVPPARHTLNVLVVGQQTSMWCWAAAGKMVMDFLGTSVTQCDEANRRFSRSDCCNRPTPRACVEGGWPEFDKYGFSFKRTSDKPLSWDEVRDQISCAKKPIAFSWYWTGGGCHMMVAIGYTTVDGQNYVRINDPLPVDTGNQSVIPYATYVSAPDHTHRDDFYDVHK